MTTNENDLVVNNINLAYKIAYKYYQKLNGFIELEELQSLCFLGLSKASKMFDKDKKNAFSTYAYIAMRNEILRYFNKIKNETNISLSQEIGENFYIENTLSSTENIEDIIEKKLIMDKLYKFIEELDEIEQKIVLGHLQDRTNKQLESIIGLNQSSIAMIYKRAINKLRIKFYKERNFEDE